MNTEDSEGKNLCADVLPTEDFFRHTRMLEKAQLIILSVDEGNKINGFACLSDLRNSVEERLEDMGSDEGHGFGEKFLYIDGLCSNVRGMGKILMGIVDNIVENSPAAVSFARREPVGKVDINDQQNSLTRETLDKFNKTFNVGYGISAVTPVSAGVCTITFDNQHNFNGLITHENLVTGVGYAVTTEYNTRLLDGGNWNGATATVTVGLGSTSITGFEVFAPGSGYQGGETLTLEGFASASIGVPTSGISNAVGDVVSITGIGITSDGLYRITSIPNKTSVAIAVTAGDPLIIQGQYLYRNSPAVSIASTHFDITTGITTITTSTPHGLRKGSKFRVVDTDLSLIHI